MLTLPARAHRHTPSGKRIRLSRISDHRTGRTLVVPLDHSVTVGPLGSADHADTLIRTLADAGADAVVLHRGRARHVDPDAFANMGLIVHLSAGTTMSIDTHAKTLVAGVEDALRMGADAVSVHVNIGSATERVQLEDFGRISAECETLGVPLLAMMYARGAGRSGMPTAAELAHLASIATDLGADMVKLDYSGSSETMRAVAASCPLPICVAGGDRAGDDQDVVALAAEIMDSGVAGLSFGRNIFEATHPHGVASALAHLVHDRGSAGNRTGTGTHNAVIGERIDVAAQLETA
ncbi:transaldolase [Rhodococcus triatomae]|uniref:2-amino-4,5-dihydroxy-6-oxo-7-(Phosphonooxy)heptanoate synthase n=1 Tax=Rhodococcus triatomae TaxID=300028 RepID=A0A1G7ZLJ0_9NOCA|nr:2-amino-3,7-dideoxy-D-threo-hept-6-ulosonate synthase [Rhodococcus triatomae]QNG18009.1 transaldolase [Rhodococcus triatomae]QNG22322.1 transaldolase [Rhodococcus triatomae]SDH09558.1 2-amino-4,5-dihydroxy-6-oxo-7-(phosphonooxy)heptanoate synthase [Rhodococcus triatomae]